MRFHLLPVEVAPIDPRHLHVEVPELTLVRQVMNREHRSRVLKPGRPAVFSFQQNRNQSGLPVVAVHNVRPQHQSPRRFHHRTAKEHKPRAVVAVVAGLISVQ